MLLVQLNLLSVQLLRLEVVYSEVALDQLADRLAALVALGPRLLQLPPPLEVEAHPVGCSVLSLHSAHRLPRPRTHSAALRLRALHSVAARSVPRLRQHLVVQLESVKAQGARHSRRLLRRSLILQVMRRIPSKVLFSNSHIRSSLPKNSA